MRKTIFRKIILMITVAFLLLIIPSSTMAAEVPGVPIGFSVNSGDGYVELAWGEPIDNGGLDITGYRIYRGIMEDGLGIVEDITDIHYTDTGLQNGQIYYYAVSALNAEGEGEKTEILDAISDSSFPTLRETLILGDWTSVSIIYVGEGVYLDIGDVKTYTLLVESVTNTRTLLSVSWNSQRLNMSEGDSKKIDVNIDGKYDFKITCDTITNDPTEGFPQTVKFSFTKKNLGGSSLNGMGGTPGFELIFILIAVALILFFKRKRIT